MIAGIILIIAGILIAVYPPLLSLIVAFLFILVGVVVVTAAWHYRRSNRHSDNPVVDVIFKF